MAISIKEIDFSKAAKGKVKLKLNKTANTKARNGIVSRDITDGSDLPPHGDYVRGFDRVTPHLGIVAGYADHNYPLINKEMIMDKKYFDDFEWSGDKRFQGLVLTGLRFKGTGSFPDSVSFVGYKECSFGGVTPLKTPYIDLLYGPAEKDGNGENEFEEEKEPAAPKKNYPLVHLLITQIQTVITEATEHYQEMKYEKSNQTSFIDDKGALVPAD